MPIWHETMLRAVRTLLRFAILPVVVQAAIGEAAELPTLNSARQVRQLTSAEAGRGYPIHLEAVVTVHSLLPNAIYAQDASAGIFVSCEQDCSGLAVGERIAIDGTSRPGKFAPVVGKAHWTALGKGILPPAPEESFGELATGRMAGQWVAVRGIVRAAVLEEGVPSVEIAMADGRIRVRAPGATLAELERLVDATVLARGVVNGATNAEHQFLRPRLLLPNPEQVTVLQRAAKDPFQLTLTPAAHLMRFDPSGDPGHRVHVRGVVTYRRPDVLFVRDEGRPLLIRTRRDTPFQLG